MFAHSVNEIHTIGEFGKLISDIVTITLGCENEMIVHASAHLTIRPSLFASEFLSDMIMCSISPTRTNERISCTCRRARRRVTGIGPRCTRSCWSSWSRQSPCCCPRRNLPRMTSPKVTSSPWCSSSASQEGKCGNGAWWSCGASDHRSRDCAIQEHGMWWLGRQRTSIGL